MPASNHLHIPFVIQFVWAIGPTSILDVGVGNGAYGLLLRQYLDIGQERITSSEWQIKIDGVEIFEGYKNPVWDFAYNTIYIQDVRTFFAQLGNYDVILFNDVLEHVERQEARALVSQALQKASLVIVTTPNSVYPQGSWGGNEAETHLCLLDDSDFPSLVAKRVAGDTTCYVCCTDKQIIDKIKEAEIFCPSYTETKVPIKRRIKHRIQRFLGST